MNIKKAGAIILSFTDKLSVLLVTRSPKKYPMDYLFSKETNYKPKIEIISFLKKIKDNLTLDQLKFFKNSDNKHSDKLKYFSDKYFKQNSYVKLVLPKGKVETVNGKEETDIETAKRECQEEAGVEIELFDPVQVFELNDVKYFLAKLKRVNEPQENRIRDLAGCLFPFTNDESDSEDNLFKKDSRNKKAQDEDYE